MKEANMINKKQFRYLCGWIFVRPRRWFFWKMICATCPQWKIKRCDYSGWELPNIHWWLLYLTIFNFFTWLNYEGWRPFCDWTGGYRRSYPLIARMIHKIGATTAGFAIGGGECFHCASDAGCQVELSEDETGEFFRLEGTQSVGTPDGTDHRFWGKTICPKCGHEEHYEDGSL
jgi:hypothetical protein